MFISASSALLHILFGNEKVIEIMFVCAVIKGSSSTAFKWWLLAVFWLAGQNPTAAKKMMAPQDTWTTRWFGSSNTLTWKKMIPNCSNKSVFCGYEMLLGWLGGRGARFNLKHNWISCSVFELMFNNNCMGEKERPGHFRGGDGAHHKPVIKKFEQALGRAIIGEGQADGFRACWQTQHYLSFNFPPCDWTASRREQPGMTTWRRPNGKLPRHRVTSVWKCCSSAWKECIPSPSLPVTPALRHH